MRFVLPENLEMEASLMPRLLPLLTFFKPEVSTTAADARRRMSASRREPTTAVSCNQDAGLLLYLMICVTTALLMTT